MRVHVDRDGAERVLVHMVHRDVRRVHRVDRGGREDRPEENSQRQHHVELKGDEAAIPGRFEIKSISEATPNTTTTRGPGLQRHRCHPRWEVWKALAEGAERQASFICQGRGRVSMYWTGFALSWPGQQQQPGAAAVVTDSVAPGSTWWTSGLSTAGPPRISSMRCSSGGRSQTRLVLRTGFWEYLRHETG